MAKAVGLDVGEYEVKIVEVDGSYKRPRVTRLAVERVARDLSMARVEEHAGADAEVVKHALRAHGIGKDNIQLGFPCRETVLRTLSVPFVGADKVRKVIKSEAEGEIHSHNVDEMVVDFFTVSEEKGSSRVLVAAAPKLPLRRMLDELRGQGLEPERVDLDAVALYRLADWAGVLRGPLTPQRSVDPGVDAAEPEAVEPIAGIGGAVRMVIDVGARSTRCLLVDRGQLREIRALRSGGDAVAEDVAAATGADLGTAREAVAHCLASGSDFVVESEPTQAAQSDGDEPAAAVTVAPMRIARGLVNEARDRFLVRLQRELVRFLSSAAGVDAVEAAFVTGGGSRMPGVIELIEDVLGCHVERLHYLHKVQHQLADDEALELEPKLAVAVGLALGGLGGPTGLNFRQEDLAFTRSFDRMKLPLAIACMLGLFCACFYGLKLFRDLSALEIAYGKPLAQKAATARGRGPAPQVQFTGHVGHLVNAGSTAQRLLSVKAGNEQNLWASMMNRLAEMPTFNRIQGYFNHLDGRVKVLQSATGYVEGMELESGAAILQELGEVLTSNHEPLGRYLVAELELRIPVATGSVSSGRYLQLVMVFRGKDFRDRQAAAEAAFRTHIQTRGTQSAFEKIADVSESLFKAGEGSYFTIKVQLRSKTPVTHTSKRS